MLIYINTFLWLLLTISLIIGLTRQNEKKIVKGLIYCRIFYLLLLVTEVVFTINHFSAHPYLIIINFIMVVVTISFVDICFQRKIQGNLKPYLVLLTLTAILLSICLLFLIQ